MGSNRFIVGEISGRNVCEIGSKRIPGINVGLIVLRLALFLLTAPSNRGMFLGSEFNRYSDEKFCEGNS